MSSGGPLRMEDLRAFYGFMLYEVPLLGSAGARNLTIVGGARDRVTAIVGGRTVDSVWRGDLEGCAENVSMLLPLADPSGVSDETDRTLQLLVEVTGRLAYGIQMQSDALIGKGLVGGAVLLDGVPLAGPWKHWALPLDSEQLQRWPTARSVGSLSNGSNGSIDGIATAFSAPQLFEGVFEIGAGDEPADCWAHFERESGWRKGQLYVNGFFQGRMWAARGPRTALFIHGPRLRKGRNMLRVVELEPKEGMAAAGATLELRGSGA